MFFLLNLLPFHDVRQLERAELVNSVGESAINYGITPCLPTMLEPPSASFLSNNIIA